MDQPLKNGDRQSEFSPKDISPYSTVQLSLPADLQDDKKIECQLIGEGSDKQNISNCQVGEMLKQMINFISFHGIEPCDIWEQKRYLSILLFTDAFERKLGYRLNSGQINCLKKISQEGMLRQEHFVQFGVWQKCSRVSLSTAISQKSFTQLKKKRISGAKILERLDNRQSQSNRQQTKTNFSKGQNSRLKTACDQLTKTFLRSGYVSEQSSKDIRLQALRSDLQMNALQKKWQFVVMAGEMNKWIEESLLQKDRDQGKIPIRFKVVNQKESFLLLKVDESGQQELVPEIVFLKKYNAMKKRHAGQVEVRAMGQAILGLIDLQGSKGGMGTKLSQRDHQLNESLLHIMRIKNILQAQHKLLSQAAINT